MESGEAYKKRQCDTWRDDAVASGQGAPPRCFDCYGDRHRPTGDYMMAGHARAPGLATRAPRSWPYNHGGNRRCRETPGSTLLYRHSLAPCRLQG